MVRESSSQRLFYLTTVVLRVGVRGRLVGCSFRLFSLCFVLLFITFCTQCFPFFATKGAVGLNHCVTCFGVINFYELSAHITSPWWCVYYVCSGFHTTSV